MIDDKPGEEFDIIGLDNIASGLGQRRSTLRAKKSLLDGGDDSDEDAARLFFKREEDEIKDLIRDNDDEDDPKVARKKFLDDLRARAG